MFDDLHPILLFFRVCDFGKNQFLFEEQRASIRWVRKGKSGKMGQWWLTRSTCVMVFKIKKSAITRAIFASRLFSI